MDVSDVQAGGFNVFGLLLAFTLIATFFFIVFWLWGCTCSSEGGTEDMGSNPNNCAAPKMMNQAVVPLYAFEIEPGTVVLQSGDGEIFRILREYDSVGRTGSGSPPLYASITTSQASNEFHYMPSYTRAHFQTRPSAPNPETHGNSSNSSSHYNRRNNSIDTHQPPEYNLGENVPLWVPIDTRNN